MRTKKVFLVVSITALVMTIALIAEKAYYVALALAVGALLMGHRELWSLIRKKKLPPIDERVRENTGKSIRNGFIFFAVATAFLMLPFSVRLVETPETVHVLGGLFVAAGAVYLISYLYYDRVAPGLGEKGMKMLRRFLLVAGIALGAFIISVILHNAIYGLFIHFFGADFWDRTGIGDEPVFFFIAVILCPLAFAVGITGSLVIFVRGLFRQSR